MAPSRSSEMEKAFMRMDSHVLYCYVVALGVTLVGSWVVLDSAGKDAVRHAKLHEYGTAVERFEASKDWIRGLDVRLDVSLNGKTVAVHRLGELTNDPTPPDAAAFAYKPLKYQSTVAHLIPTLTKIPGESMDTHLTLSIQRVTDMNNITEIAAGPQARPTRHVLAVSPNSPLVAVTKSKQSSWKGCVHGQHGSFRHEDSMCTVFSRVATLCLRIACVQCGQPDERFVLGGGGNSGDEEGSKPGGVAGEAGGREGGDVVRGSGGGVGCWPSTPNQYARYKVVPPRHPQSNGVPDSIALERVTVTVRSELDPAIAAERIQRGGRSFGLTSSEALGIGIGTTLVGLVMAMMTHVAYMRSVFEDDEDDGRREEGQPLVDHAWDL